MDKWRNNRIGISYKDNAKRLKQKLLNGPNDILEKRPDTSIILNLL